MTEGSNSDLQVKRGLVVTTLLFEISRQESRERMTELLNVDPKEEDFECREEFPGTVYGQVFLFLGRVLAGT